MRLEQRLKRIEDRARPMQEAAEQERRRSLLGRFAMCRLLCWGFTRAESLDVLERSNRRKNRGGLETIPHWTAEYIPELFQAFLSANPEAARLYKALTDYRTDGELYEETIRLNTEPMTAIVIQLIDRLEAYFMETARVDFLDYKRIIAEWKRRMEGNEQSKIQTQQN
jgi:hypothetical protein